MDAKQLKQISQNIGVTVQVHNKEEYMMDSLLKRAEHWVKMSPKQTQESAIVEFPDRRNEEKEGQKADDNQP
ncbi:hypothetical protein [Vibrio sp. 10N.222.54.B11]|uniref:hypothetical protein n=1 Tax=Vibrio sp. 10N.222.54.B11 TaxID=3229635 RepID=UPI003550176A